MILNKHVFLAVVIIAYTVAFITTFDALGDSILILSVALIGFCGWFYGIRIGLISIIPYTLLNTVILILVSGQTYFILQAFNPLGHILSIIVVLVTGSMHESQIRLTNLKTSLAARVDEATTEMEQQIQQLIANDEHERIRIGQDLHDGVGQYLTGMLLHSEALSEQLTEQEFPEAQQAQTVMALVHDNLTLIRRLARSFLPNHLQTSGFSSAMDDMIDYFRETTETEFRLLHPDSNKKLPNSMALQLYRIAQESIFCIQQNCQAKRIDIQMQFDGTTCTFTIDGFECNSASISNPLLASRILKYRARTINGSLRFENPTPYALRLKCTAQTQGEA